MSLYQKYRPKDFDVLVEQDFVRSALSNALAQDRTVHGYLFYGSRGTGKTTVARIFAKAVNCTNLRPDGNPCGECENCKAFDEGRMIDVVEIDAASNNGVDHIRDLIERARFQPTLGKFKVYIVDEVHMLSKGAFNALLKTLEEPPEHVKFVLATTDIAKVPETVVSRTQRYDFRRISEPAIVERLNGVAKAEKIDAEPAAISRIARLARGGLRDALTLFEQFVLDGKVTAEYVERRLGLVGDEFLSHLEEGIRAGDSSAIFARTEELRVRATDPLKFAEEFLTFLRDRIVGEGTKSADFPFLSDLFETVSQAYPRMRVSPDPMIVLEAALARAAYGPVERAAVSVPAQKKAPVLETPAAPSPKVAQPEPVKESSAPIPSETPPAPAAVEKPQEKEIPTVSVLELVNLLKEAPRSAALAMAVKSAPKCFFADAETFVIVCMNSLSEGQLSKPESKNLILDSIEKLTGTYPKLKIEIAK
jgi:DNA polymerase-3 subunit gamma/tau